MTNELFRVTTVESVHVVELTIPETLDDADFDRLSDSVLTLLASQPDAAWVLDLTSLSYAGSALLGLIVNIRQRVRQAGGRLVLCGLSPRLLTIFQTCSLARLFRIVRSQADAVRAAK